MLPFETVGPDGRTYLHYDNWERWRAERMQEYPRPHNHLRFDIELAYPRERLTDVPVDHNPHSLGGYQAHDCFYVDDNWSTIYGVHDAHLYATGGPSLRMLIENNCPEPIWGERIRMYSTSSTFDPEPWGWGIPNRFAFFRGQYWRVMMVQRLQDRTPFRARFSVQTYDWSQPQRIPFVLNLDFIVPFNLVRARQERANAVGHRLVSWYDPPPKLDFSWSKEGF